MQASWKSQGKPLHTRNITVTTYPHDGQRMIVEGTLRDERCQECHMITGETLPPGVIHHMSISLLIHCANLAIEDVHVDLMCVPEEACLETKGSLEAIRGLTITRGFSAKVKKLVGGNRGCTHLRELLLVMAPAAFQGLIVYRTLRPSPFDPGRAKKVLESLFDTCHAWSEKGPFVARIRRLLDSH